MRLRYLLTGGLLAVGLVVATTAPAMAAPPGPPDYGVVEPAGFSDKGCPWPDEANDDPAHDDAQKCLPGSIPWSGNEHNGVVSYGVRIISDALSGAGDDIGQVTFRCQSRVGLQYKITVQNLEPRTAYTVHAVRLGPNPTPMVLGSFTTDPAGNGILNGTLHLDGGGYGFLIHVLDAGGAQVLQLAPEPDGPGVVGLAVLDAPPRQGSRL